MAFFRESEFKCPCCGKLPPNGMHVSLMAKIEFLRSVWKKPIHVSSGFRCERHNQAVGGALHSKHLTGEAADLMDPDGELEKFITEPNLLEWCISREDPMATPGWVHLDICPRNGTFGTFKV
jgi:hypothetical protein